MKNTRFQATVLSALLALATGCHFSIESHGTRKTHKPGATAKIYTVVLEITDVSDSNNPVKIATPKITVLPGQEASMTIGELNKQFIEIEVVVNEGEQTVGTIQFNIMKDDRRASGKITALVGQTAGLQTGGFEMKVLIQLQPTDGE